jgi:hypothetical protein
MDYKSDWRAGDTDQLGRISTVFANAAVRFFKVDEHRSHRRRVSRLQMCDRPFASSSPHSVGDDPPFLQPYVFAMTPALHCRRSRRISATDIATCFLGREQCRHRCPQPRHK